MWTGECRVPLASVAPARSVPPCVELCIALSKVELRLVAALHCQCVSKRSNAVPLLVVVVRWCTMRRKCGICGGISVIICASLRAGFLSSSGVSLGEVREEEPNPACTSMARAKRGRVRGPRVLVHAQLLAVPLLLVQLHDQGTRKHSLSRNALSQMA